MSVGLAFAYLLANAPNPEDCPGGDCGYYSDEGDDPLWLFIAIVAVVLALVVGLGLFLWRRRRSRQ